MDSLVRFSAWFSLVASIIVVVLGPFLIGKPKSESVHTASSYIAFVLSSAMMVILVGRVFDWW